MSWAGVWCCLLQLCPHRWAGCTEVARLLPESLPSEPVTALLTHQTAVIMIPRPGQARGRPSLAGGSPHLCPP